MMAETLIELANEFNRINCLLTTLPKIILDNPGAIDRLVVALKFKKLPPVIQFRAMVEDWEYSTIKRQVYN